MANPEIPSEVRYGPQPDDRTSSDDHSDDNGRDHPYRFHIDPSFHLYEPSSGSISSGAKYR